MKVILKPIMIGAFGTVTIIKGTAGLRSWSTSGEHPNYSIIENGHNRKKSPGDFKSFVVTQTPVIDDQLTLMWKTLRE